MIDVGTRTGAFKLMGQQQQHSPSEVRETQFSWASSH